MTNPPITNPPITNPLPFYYRGLPTAVDLLTIAGYYVVVPWMSAMFLSQSAWNHLLLAPGYLLVMVGVVLIRSLPDYRFDENKGPSIIAVCLAFVFVIAYSMLYTESTNIGGSESSNEGWLLVIFFLYIGPFLMSFFWPTQPSQAGTRSALLIESGSIAIVNYFTIIGAAVWYGFEAMGEPENAVYATGLSHLILWALLVMLFIVFFGLPRVFLLKATGDRRGFILYVVGIGLFLWNRIPAVN